MKNLIKFLTIYTLISSSCMLIGSEVAPGNVLAKRQELHRIENKRAELTANKNRTAKQKEELQQLTKQAQDLRHEIRSVRNPVRNRGRIL